MESHEIFYDISSSFLVYFVPASDCSRSVSRSEFSCSSDTAHGKQQVTRKQSCAVLPSTPLRVRTRCLMNATVMKTPTMNAIAAAYSAITCDGTAGSWA